MFIFYMAWIMSIFGFAAAKRFAIRNRTGLDGMDPKDESAVQGKFLMYGLMGGCILQALLVIWLVYLAVTLDRNAMFLACLMILPLALLHRGTVYVRKGLTPDAPKDPDP